MEAAALAFGTIGFWLFISTMAVLMLTCINFQKGAGATIVFIGTMLGLQFLGGIDIWGYVIHNKMTILYYVLGYAAFGVATSVFKWWRYVRNNVEKYLEAKAEYQSDNGNLTDWARYRDQGRYNAIKFIFEPVARRHKAVITMWITYWPLVLLWTLINDPVRKAIIFLRDHVMGILERISKNAFKDVDNDLPVKSRRQTVGSLDDE